MIGDHLLEVAGLEHAGRPVRLRVEPRATTFDPIHAAGPPREDHLRRAVRGADRANAIEVVDDLLLLDHELQIAPLAAVHVEHGRARAAQPPRLRRAGARCDPHERPRSREERGDRTAQALLAAGRTAFSVVGYAAASVRDIARAAGVNPALVRYHFGSKEGLYRQVIEVGPGLGSLTIALASLGCEVLAVKRIGSC